MSVLAMAISLFAAVLAGVSGVPPIPAADFIMLSLVHAIIAADAGDSERVNATKATAVSKIFIEKSPPQNETGAMPAFAIAHFPAETFRREDNFLAAMQGRMPQRPSFGV